MTPERAASKNRHPAVRAAALSRIREYPWVVLSLWTLLIAVLHSPHHGWSWHYFVTGAHSLFGSAPLSLYAHHPELQMGPLAFVAAAPFVLLVHGTIGEVLAMILMLAIGLAIVREIRMVSFQGDVRKDTRWILSGMLLMAAWAELAVHWGHLDDALALLAAVTAIRLLRTGHTLGAATALALAVDCKPWALPFAILLFWSPKRTWLASGAVWVLVVSAAWLPFLLGDPGTLTAIRFGITVDTASTLHLFDAADRATPRWDRYAQVSIALILAGISMWRHRWANVLVIVIAVRLLLDPGTKNYYDAGLLVGTAVFDIAATAGIVPILTITAIALVYLPSYALAAEPSARGIVRTVGLLLILGASLWSRFLRRTLSPGATRTAGGFSAP